MEVKRVPDAQVGPTRVMSNDVTAQTTRESDHRIRRTSIARASWYKHGSITANGERFNQNAFTAAHKTLPFNTLVRLTNPENGKSVVVRINDRGPFVRGREFDVTYRCAKSLGMLDSGVVKLVVERF